jgi:tyrosyl-tRNA synthetase
MQAQVADSSVHPMDLKKQMAFGIIQEFWSQTDAIAAQENFIALFQKKDLSQGKQVVLPTAMSNPVWVIDLLKELGAISSTSEGKRLIESSAVSIDGKTVTEFKEEVAWQAGMSIKVGKHRIYLLV